MADDQQLWGYPEVAGYGLMMSLNSVNAAAVVLAMTYFALPAA